MQPGDVLNLELSNLTDGSNCPSFQVEPTRLTCVTGYTQTLPITGTLAGGERNTWAPGDEYEIGGDPRALGNLVLDSFYKLATQMKGLDLDNPATAEFAATLPLIGLSARDLSTQLDAIAAAVVDLKSGTEDAEVRCKPPDENEAEAGNLFCKAFTDVPEITAAKWSLSAGHGVFTETAFITDTIGISPTASTSFSLSVPTVERDQFQITVVFTDSHSTVYTGTYPSTPINDLSDLQKRLVTLLRRKNGTEVKLDFNPLSLSGPANDGASNLHLVPRLEIGEEGERLYRLHLDFGEVELTATDPYSRSLSLDYDADVQMEVGIPLTPSMSAYDVWVRDTTGLTLSISAGDSEVDLEATLGGAAVAVGASATLMGSHSLETFTGTHTSGSVSTTTLTASLDIEALGVITGSTTILTNTGIGNSKAATCTVQAIDGNVVTCKEPLNPVARWEKGDVFELSGPSTKRLHDPEVDFSKFEIQPRSRVTNTTKDAACTIALPIPDGSHVLSCTNVLSSTAAWEQGDEYKIEGMGEVEMELTSVLTLDRPHFLAGFTDALTHTFSSPRQDVISATLWVSLTEGERLDEDVEVAYRLEDLPDGPPRGEFGHLLAAVQKAPIDWTLLPLPLELLDDIVRQNLDGRWWNFGVPLVGYDLAAGTDDEIERTLDEVGAKIALDASGVVSGTMHALCDNPGNVITETIQFKVVTDTIGTYSCFDDLETLAIEDEKVKDLEITFTISDTEENLKPGFGLGLPGLPVTAEEDQTVQAEASWALSVTFGLSRTVGPYIRAGDDDGLLVTATASFPDSPNPNDCHKKLPGFLEGKYAGNRCLNAVLGFLPGTLFDSKEFSSTLALTTTLNLNANNDLLTFGQMLKRTSAHTVKVWAAAEVDVAFAADLDRRKDLLPIAGTFHLGFDTGGLKDVADGIDTGWITVQPSYKDVHMNVASFFGGFVGPMVEDVQDFTRPLQPPIDTLSAPVPVINDLSQALGQGPISMLTMLAAVSGNDLTLLERLGGFISFINNLPADDKGVWIGLGGDDEAGEFSLDAEITVKLCSEETEKEALGTKWKVKDCVSKDKIERTWEKDLLDNTKPTKSGREVTKKISAEATAEWQRGGISLPFLSDTRQIYGMLLGIDATLLRVDLGTVSAGAGFSYSYYTVFVTPIGPIPVEFIVGGDVSVTGRFAMGYDTRGLRHALAGESFNETALLDGIFIDDYDADGNEVPELRFSASFYAGAAVSIRIVKVGLDMGVTFTVDLDLNDPNADGKMYIDEIMLWRFNPVCLFEFTGTLEFFLRMYVEVDLFLFTVRAEWYPFKYAFNLFNVKCQPPRPVLAEEDTYDDKVVLRLNVGEHRTQRNIYMDETDEKMTVLQLTVAGQGCSTRNAIHEYQQQGDDFKAGPSSTCPLTQTTSYRGTWVSVAFQGIKQSFFLPVTKTVPIYADADVGKDVIRLEPGSDQDGNEIPFELQALIWGGDGDDRITTGNGDDEIWGEGGQDVINAGLGDDTIDAGSGDDSVDANLGDDLVYGGEGNDILNGGPGIDALDGGEDDDRLTGGPGLPAGFEDELQDKDDILVGGGGDDLLEGDYGNNLLFGDALQGYTGSTDYDEDGDIDEEESLREFHDFLISAAVGLPEAFDFYKEEACRDGENGVSGKDTLTGGNEDDLLFGGPENDSLAGGKGNDYVCGNAGHDILDGSQGDDDLYGGLGNDQLRGGSGHDLLVGGDGNDLLRGDIGYDALVGDRLQLVAAEGSDALVGGADNDLMLGDSGWITITDNLSATNTAVLTEVLASIELPVIIGTITGTVYCSLRVGVISGTLDLNGDDVVNGEDSGFFEGYPVVDGYVNYDMDASEEITGTDTGFINSILIQDGLVDASGDGVADTGDTGTVLGVAIVGDGNADCLFGNEGTDYLFGGPADDRLFGDAEMDYLEGNGGNDTMRGGQDNDIMYGDDSCTQTGCAGGAVPTPPADPGNDLMFGDSGDDQMYGSAGNDIMHGGIGDDTMEGNQDSDEMYGDADHDDMIGGTSRPGIEDADDLMHGNAGHDVMSGDNATITRTGETKDFSAEVTGVPLREVSLYDVAESGVVPLPDASFSGKDVMWGDSGYDVMYGQGNGEMVAGQDLNLCNGLDDDGNGIIDDEDRAGDCMHGGDGPDYMEGNAGDDTMSGDAGQDDMLGGTSPALCPTAGEGSCLDADDWMYGESGDLDGDTDGDGADVLLGDNGTITRPLSSSGWMTNTYNSALSRIITLSDVETSANTGTFPHAVHGNDQMWGNSNDDVMYGQGGQDQMHGGAGDDYMEGNAGSDRMYGGPDQDDMIGGTGPTTSNDLSTALPGRIDHSTITETLSYTDCLDVIQTQTLDLGDSMEGGDDADVMLGDNGVISRPLTAGGTWQVNTFNNAFTRQTWLFDIATLSQDADDGSSGRDAMWGNAADDLMYGQGSEDLMYGGPGDDYMEGNAGSDLMQGEGDEDDIIGGTGRINDDPPTGTAGRIDAATLTRTVILGTGTEVVPYGDELCGGDGADVILGDNGIVSRPLADGQWIILNYELFAVTDGLTIPRHTTAGTGSRTYRVMQMVDSVPGEVAGSDLLLGGPGDDDLVGEFDNTTPAGGPPAIGDELWGGPGEDAMVGDSGVVENWVLGGETQFIAPNPPFFDDHIFVKNTLYRQVTLHEVEIGGDDRMRGQEDGDWMHGGAGNDLMNGNTGNDRLFGDDGNDVMWGGFDHDHLYGGHGDDYLDVKPREEMTVGKKNQQMTLPADIVEWFAFGEDDNGHDNYQDVDYIYGGWGQDAMQADVGDNGPVAGDRLIDWVGAYNAYYLCPALYGEFVVTRSHSPSVIEFLQQLAEGDGVLQPADSGSSGFNEVAMVFPNEAKYNSHPVHPDNPGHFTCVQATPPDLAIDMTDGLTSVVPGQILTYALTVRNLGELDATGVAVNDVLPAGATFVAASHGGSHAGGVVTWPTFTLAGGASLDRKLTVQLANPLPPGTEVLTNTASVADDDSHGPDQRPENNTATDEDIVVTMPDLAINLTDGQTVAVPGQVLTYTLTISNLGTSDASGVVIVDSLPASTTFLGASEAGSHANGVVTWPAFTLARGEWVSRTVSVRLDDQWPAGIEEINNQATVADDGSHGPDMNPGDNRAWDGTFLEAAPDLEMTKYDGGMRVGPGQALSYTLIYTNAGNQGAAGLVLTETVPSYTTFHAAASSAGWSCADGSPAGTACTLAVGDLAADSSDTAQFAVMVIDPLPAEVAAITNTASIGDDGLNGPDPEPADNQGFVATPVNHPPEAREDSFVMPEGSANTALDVMQNDLDVDGDALLITAVTTATHGTVVQTATGLVYTPPAGFSGTDLFTYTVSDGTLTATAVVTVVVELGEEPPAATGDDVGSGRMAWTIS